MSGGSNIWNDNNGRLPEDKLIAYLEGRLTAEEQHEVELWLAEEGMEADALEGLKNVPTNDTQQVVSRLNRDLHSKVAKNYRRRSRPIRDNKWAMVAVLLILLFAIVAYIIIKLSAMN